MESPRLRILILGTPVVTWDGVPVRIARQQIRLLLYYLAMQWQPVNRNTICQVFWTEKDDITARKLLREALSKLRAALPDPTVIVTESGDVYLDPKKVYMDGLEFKKLTDPLLESAEFKRDVVLPGWMYTDMRKALDLCRGSLTMEKATAGMSAGLENFLSLSGQAYDYIRLRIEERLASHCIAIGDLEEAIAWLSRTREIDPLNDDNNFLLINCLMDYGRSKDALEFITYLENFYAQADDQKLPETILAQRTRLLESHEITGKDTPEWPGIEEHPVPYVGREDLLEKLRNAYVRKGIVSIRGPSGIGKNRLLQEFYLNLPRKPRLIFCTGKPMVRCSPFEPIIEGFRAAVKPEEWLRLPLEYREPLKVLFPELRAVEKLNGIDGEHVDAAHDFLRICEGLHQLLILMAEKKPILLVMDIVVWADEASVEFLSYLSDRNFYKLYGLLVILSRKEESSPAFEIFVDRNLHLGTLEKIDVLPLTRDESAFLVRKMLGREPSPQFIEKFYLQTGGNPYIMVEGLTSLLTLNFNFDQYNSTSLYPIPDTIKALIDEKIRLLPESGLNVLRAGSVLGQYFQAEVVEAMIDIPSSEMIYALEMLEKLSIVSIRNGADGSVGYFFDHNQIREVVLQTMSPLRKRHLHLAAVNALTSVFGHKPELESIYACHYEEAGEPAKAFTAWLMAAEFARTRFSKSDRYFAYEKASKLISRLPHELLVENTDRLVTDWGNYAFDLTDVSTCLKIYNLCLEIGEQTQDPILLADAWNGLSRVYDMKLEFDAGIEAATRAQFYCDRIDHLALKLETLTRLAILYSGKTEVRKSIDYCEKVLEFETQVKTQREMDVMVTAQVQLALMYLISGWPRKTADIGEKVLNLSLLVKRRSAKVQAAAVLAAGQYYMGEYQKSLQNAMAVRDLAERLNYRWWLSFLEVLIGRNHLAFGEMDKSWIFCQSAMEREEPHKNNGVYALALSLNGSIFHLFGDTSHAEQMFEKGMSLEVKNFQTLDNFVQYARIRGSSEPILGIKLFEEIIEQAEKNGLGLISFQARLGRCLCSVLAQGYQKRIESEIDKIENDLKNRGVSISWLGEYIKALGEKESGNKDKARLHYRRLSGEGQSISNVWASLQGVYGLCALAESETEKEKNKKVLRGILAKIGEDATLPPLRRWFYIYRKKVLSSI